MTGARATKVLKKIEPGQPGALKWAQRYGPSLLCVRYRFDPAGTQRLTTVELVVDRAPAAPPMGGHVFVRIGYDESELRQRAKAAGAIWHKDAKLWQMAAAAARACGLQRRVVKKLPDMEVDK